MVLLTPPASARGLYQQLRVDRKLAIGERIEVVRVVGDRQLVEVRDQRRSPGRGPHPAAHDAGLRQRVADEAGKSEIGFAGAHIVDAVERAKQLLAHLPLAIRPPEHNQRRLGLSLESLRHTEARARLMKRGREADDPWGESHDPPRTLPQEGVAIGTCDHQVERILMGDAVAVEDVDEVAVGIRDADTEQMIGEEPFPDQRVGREAVRDPLVRLKPDTLGEPQDTEPVPLPPRAVRRPPTG